MIPTAIILGLILGLALKAWWWSIPIAVAAWVVWLAADSSDVSVGWDVGVWLLGLANAGLGVAVGHGFRVLFRGVWSSLPRSDNAQRRRRRAGARGRR